ncbi:thymocyte nuclear protein 1-like isoform X2 [Patiria miniata]|uniref:Thymocyte nuclear protein 1 n=1 Tax=Patiria miniata TaxID=46514 RepID=A0A913ZJJ2_PATMI|nr:thymocyte nuclear protein 1-like isoform X2 [Patiria miniata]
MPPRKRPKTDQPSNKPAEKKTKSGSKAASSSKSSTDGVSVVYTRWLMKSEPESRIEKGVDVKFGLEDLKKEPDQTACWDGVRNYQARNFLRDQMKVGHLAFFYHSNTKVPGIAGIIKITKEGYVDHTQFDKKDPHYDSSSTKDNPRWFMVDVKYICDTKRFISLAELKGLYQKHAQSGGPLKNLALFTRARLSVQPVTEEEFDFILGLEDKPAA